MDVATPEGWQKNKTLVLDFYNQRRRQLFEVKPNRGHEILAELENHFDVHIITQNVDDLHERAGSSNVLHLHGELLKARSTKNPDYIIDWKDNLNLGDCDPNGNQLRPHIVWFGEGVPALDEAVHLTQQADIFAVIGTSLQVYPAAGLIDFANFNVPVFYIDPKPAQVANIGKRLEIIAEPASVGMEILRNKLLN